MLDAPAPISVNTIGFTPPAPKLATIAAACDAFRVVRLGDGAVVFDGRAGAPFATAPTDTRETVQIADFSALTAPGRYELNVPGVGRSAPFAVGADVWNEPFYLVTRALYLWRCGTAVRTEWHGRTYEHGPCHLEDAWLDYAGGGHVRQPGTGGWHDAGDYNKYTVNAGVTVGLMLKAWEQFRGRIAGVRLDLPESGDGMPDFLHEIRWELEWLLTMPQPDGRVRHKLSALDFDYWGPPDHDRTPRYFSPWSTTATAVFSAMLAGAARHFRAYDTAFADRCLTAALRSWACLLRHPADVPADLHAFHTGAYQTDDRSHRLWAAIELWETTGNLEYLHEFERHARRQEFDFSGPGWGDVHDLALGSYLLTARSPAEREPALVARLTENLCAQAARIAAVAVSNGYGRPLGVEPRSWFWGCNGVVAAQTYLLQAANQLRPDPRWRETALSSLAFLFGRNYHRRSYVTGLGARPPEHPHDRRGEPAWPGYLVGGGWPDGTSWVDEQQNYRVNEIAINWNAALIYALAAFVHPDAAPHGDTPVARPRRS